MHFAIVELEGPRRVVGNPRRRPGFVAPPIQAGLFGWLWWALAWSALVLGGATCHVLAHPKLVIVADLKSDNT